MGPFDYLTVLGYTYKVCICTIVLYLNLSPQVSFHQLAPQTYFATAEAKENAFLSEVYHLLQDETKTEFSTNDLSLLISIMQQASLHNASLFAKKYYFSSIEYRVTLSIKLILALRTIKKYIVHLLWKMAPNIGRVSQLLLTFDMSTMSSIPTILEKEI